MGGYNSGRTKYTTYLNELIKLGIGTLNKQGVVKAAVGSKATLTWSINGNECSIGLYRTADGLELAYSVQREDGTRENVRQLSVFQYTPCHFGKPRTWFSCPICGSRVGLLYLHRKRFKCRKCTGLNYRSQGETVEVRMQRNHDKYRSKLCPEAVNWEMGAIPDKPKRMRWTTYELIASKAAAYEEARLSHLDAKLAKWLGRYEDLREEVEALLG